MPITFELYRHATGGTRWRLRAADGRIVADSGGRDVDRDDAREAAELLGRLAPSIAVEDLTGGDETPHTPQYDLGELPAELEIRWPTLPTIEREATITTTDGDSVRCDQPRTRYLVQTDVDEVVVAAPDVVLAVADDAHVGRAFVDREVKRVHFDGGRYGTIELAIPADYNTTPATWREEWLVEDVLIEGVDVCGVDGLALRGRRIAVLSSRVHVNRYAVWVGDTDDLWSEDVVVADNELVSGGGVPEATVRIHSTRRSVVVDNVLSNSGKHNYRVHQRSDLAFAARNTLVHTGLMIAGIPIADLGEEDVVGTVWFSDNVIHYYATNGLAVVNRDGLERFVAEGNTVYSDDDDGFSDGELPEAWSVAEHTIQPYRPYCPSHGT